MSPLSEAGRQRARMGMIACRVLGALAILCAVTLFVWPPAKGADSEGPESYVRLIRIVVTVGFAYVFLRVGSYLDWRSRGAQIITHQS